MTRELTQHERDFIETNKAEVLALSDTHILFSIKKPMYALYMIRTRGDKYMGYVSDHAFEDEARRKFAAVSPNVPTADSDELEVALPHAVVLQLVVRGQEVPYVKAALRGAWSAADSNARDQNLPIEGRHHWAGVRQVMAELLEQLKQQ